MVAHRTRVVEVISADPYGRASGGHHDGGQVIGEDGLAGAVDTVDANSYSVLPVIRHPRGDVLEQ